MDEVSSVDVMNVLIQLPNLIIAIWVILTQQKLIQQMLDKDKETVAGLLRSQDSLITRLMELHPPQTEKTAEAIAERKN